MDDPIQQLHDEMLSRARDERGGATTVPASDPADALHEEMLNNAKRESEESMTHWEPEKPKALKWGHGEQLYEGLTQGFGSRWEAMKRSLATPEDNPTVETIMRNYHREHAKLMANKAEYVAASPIQARGLEAFGSAASTIPLLAGGEALAAPMIARGGLALADAIPALSGAVGRTAATVVRGAGQGATAGTIQSGLGKDSVGSQALEGAMIGAPLAVVGNAVGGPFRSGITPRNAEIAQRMLGLGIPLRTADIPGAPLTARIAGRFIGPKGEEQQGAFTKALGKTFGEDLEKIDYPAVMKAKGRIGAEYDALAPLTKVPQLEGPLMQDLGDVRMRVNALDPKVYAGVTKALDNVESLVASGDIDGNALRSLRGPGGSVGALTRSTDGTIRHFGQEIERGLMEAAERNSPPDVMERLARANRQYKNLHIADTLTDERTGLVNPTKLLSAVEKKKAYGTAHESKAGDIGVLAQGGEGFLSPPPKPPKAASGSSVHKAAGTAALGAIAGEQLAEHAPAIAGHLTGGNELAAILAGLYGGAGLAHGAYAQTPVGTRNLLNAARGTGGLPWWAGRGVQPLIPLGTALEGQKW
jgi:hypothetical protein